MTRSDFQSNMTAADTFRRLSSEPDEQDFWTGYQRGLRRKHHGDKFADNHHDTSRKMRGLGYRAGFDGQNIQQAMKTLAGRQYMSEIGRRGGSSTSPKKARSSADNGRLGGRPRKSDGRDGAETPHLCGVDTMKKVPPILDKIVDVVLSYRPKPLPKKKQKKHRKKSTGS